VNVEVFVASFERGERVLVGPLTNVSQNAGYDNQPSFLPDGRGLLFASDRDGTQTDIYRYDLASGQTTQLTHTAEREYSPLVTPDGRTFSVIRVEADGTQRLWRFDLDGTNPRLVLADVKPVGYHLWIDATHLALFVLGQPNTLQLADTATGTATVIESGIGRSILRRPGAGTVSFISKPAGGGRWLVKQFDPVTRRVTTLIETADDNKSEDSAWDESGTLYMSSGTRLMSVRPGESAWRVAADLSSRGIGAITRFAIGPAGPGSGGRGTLALVAEPGGR
jgi:dipeptidyl aminopeptidase/acylaminoacyl peptidase